MNINVNIRFIAITILLAMTTCWVEAGQDMQSERMYKLSFKESDPQKPILTLSEMVGQTIAISTNIDGRYRVDLMSERISKAEAIYLLVQALWRADIRIVENADGEFLARVKIETEASAAEPYVSEISSRLAGGRDVSEIAAKHSLPPLPDGAEPFLEILSLSPESPAVMSEDSRITARIRYGCASTNAVRIWLRANHASIYSPSAIELGGIGILERWVWLGHKDRVVELRATMVDQDTQKTIAELKLPVNYTRP